VESFVLPKADLGSFVAKLKVDAEVLGPVAKESKFVFDTFDSVDDLQLDYDTTILPPKKFFVEAGRPLFSFEGTVDATSDEKAVGKRVLLGVHSCDINGLLSLDKVFLGTYPDPYYKARRENTVLIGLNCVKPCPNGFCASFNTGPAMDIGFDLCLTDVGDKYIVEVGSVKGNALVKDLAVAEDGDLVSMNRAIRASQQKITRRIDEDDLSEFLHQNFDHPVWDELQEKCLACGSCTSVCPTCYCFAVEDKVDLTLKNGVRQRTWDSCLFYEFSRVAMDHIFTPDRAARIKQRMYHKLAYYKQQFEAPGCVGCGRCVGACVVHIDPVDVVARIQANPNPVTPVKLYKPPDKKVTPETNPWAPQKAVIKAIEQQTADVKTYTFAFADPKVQANYTYDNGAFNLISIFGVGEAAISISSSPDHKDVFQHTIRAVGNVTNAIDKLQVGDVVGIRGPYGFGWPVEEMKGKNILLIAGGVGLAPLRGVVKTIDSHREQFGHFEILYGSRTPDGMLFTDEFEDFRKIPNTRLFLTVDYVPPGVEWGHNIGVVTTLFDKVATTPENSIVVTCGPDIMMKFVVRDLLRRGYSADQIYVSLERRMSCGIKKCGNCQIGPVFVCQDGPVFKYADIKDLPGGIF
jgi:NAD(P)H-flavin reductase/formate hydrogenlyase subunit 6/NADH:ubiquinone oxidoreductase subunit I